MVGEEKRARRMKQYQENSKARMLQRASALEHARVLPLRLFAVADWETNPSEVEDQIFSDSWSSGPLIVRSSAQDEDVPGASSAGRYVSVLNVRGLVQFRNAVEKVRESYQCLLTGRHEIFVQPMLEGAIASGAATSIDPSSGSPYKMITWSPGPVTDQVTSGRSGKLYQWCGLDDVPGWHAHPIIGPVLATIEEIERVFGLKAFEIEFALDACERLVLFQIRELTGNLAISTECFRSCISKVAAQARATGDRDPRILGRGVSLGSMPDWNPAELIGVRPMPLARSLYQRMVTDTAWAVRRFDYGYRDMRGIPLMIDLAGHGLVDVRASQTSLIPATLPQQIAERLADA